VVVGQHCFLQAVPAMPGSPKAVLHLLLRVGHLKEVEHIKDDLRYRMVASCSQTMYLAVLLLLLPSAHTDSG
jgi:hypothetical protein